MIKSLVSGLLVIVPIAVVSILLYFFCGYNKDAVEIGKEDPCSHPFPAISWCVTNTATSKKCFVVIYDCPASSHKFPPLCNLKIGDRGEFVQEGTTNFPGYAYWYVKDGNWTLEVPILDVETNIVSVLATKRNLK